MCFHLHQWNEHAPKDIQALFEFADVFLTDNASLARTHIKI